MSSSRRKRSYSFSPVYWSVFILALVSYITPKRRGIMLDDRYTYIRFVPKSPRFAPPIALTINSEAIHASQLITTVVSQPYRCDGNGKYP